MSNQLTIKQVSKQVGLPAKTIRYYEFIGIFKPLHRKENKYRIFSERDIQRLHLIKRARDLGLQLSEIKNIVSQCIDKGCLNAKEYVSTKVPSYIRAVDEKIKEFGELKKGLLLLENHYKNKSEWQHKSSSCCEILDIKISYEKNIVI